MCGHIVGGVGTGGWVEVGMGGACGCGSGCMCMGVHVLNLRVMSHLQIYSTLSQCTRSPFILSCKIRMACKMLRRRCRSIL